MRLVPIWDKYQSHELRHIGLRYLLLYLSLQTLFQSGNVVQLVSRASGRSLQIVQGPAGLVVDGLGADNNFNGLFL